MYRITRIYTHALVIQRDLCVDILSIKRTYELKDPSAMYRIPDGIEF